MGTEEIRKDMNISSWCAELVYDQWTPLPVNGKPPSARYKHAAAVVDDKFYVVGGSRYGRFLSDVQVFNFKSLSWSSITLSFESNAGSGSKENLIATSGHALIKWENKLLIIGGHSKSSSDITQVQAQIVELQKVLDSISSVENEVNALRSQKTALERDVELASATRQGSDGFLGWLSGGPRSQ